MNPRSHVSSPAFNETASHQAKSSLSSLGETLAIAQDPLTPIFARNISARVGKSNGVPMEVEFLTVAVALLEPDTPDE